MRVPALAAIVAALCAIPQAQTFRSTVAGVRVDVLVLEGDKPVTGLSAGDFELLDDGVPQRIQAVQVEQVPLSMMLALDVSQSVAGHALADLKQAARAAVAALRASDRAAVLTFSERISLAADWTGDRQLLNDAVDRAAAGGSTSLNDVAYAALTLRDAEPRRALALIFTDGVDTTSWLPPSAVFEAARRTDVVVYGIGLRKIAKPISPVNHNAAAALDLGLERESTNEPLLQRLAGITGGRMLYADQSRGNLEAAFVQAVNEFQRRYVLLYSPSGVPATGWHTLAVRLPGRQVTVKAREGYWR
ncbi:MAG TPA: VWA domain-containing protein [Vicinamibacterales bacterium]|nr:VWA domain-containing protein [Vicinamibacterales bacterium]